MEENMTVSIGQDFVVESATYQVHKRFTMKKGDILRVIGIPKTGMLQISDAWLSNIGKLVVVPEKEFLSNCSVFVPECRAVN